jgi:sugar lactone lactonase YvrE
MKNKYILPLTFAGVLFSFGLMAQSYTISTIAGTATSGYNGDNIAATSSELSGPYGDFVDKTGNLYISDYSNNRIRLVNTSGIISTIAGNGTGGYSGDGGAATAAEINFVRGVALDTIGNVYISDFFNHCIRIVNTNGIISTFAGTGVSGYNGDNIAATAAELNYPQGVAIDKKDNIYISDEGNNRIRMVNTSGIITTVAGNGISGFSGDGGLATVAEMSDPNGVAVDMLGNVYFDDEVNNRIRQVNTSGVINTVAGSGAASYSGDGGPATAAGIFQPIGVAVDISGNLYIGDNNQRLRYVDAIGNISTIAGTGVAGFSGDGGPATAAKISSPWGVTVDASGKVYLCDWGNYRIRLLTPLPNASAEQMMQTAHTSVYPNPNNGRFTIESPLIRKPSVLEIYNMLGEKVYSESFTTPHSESNISIENQPAGIYMYRISSENGGMVSAGKFIIQ